MDNQQRPQDPLVTTRSTTKKKNSKGGDWLVLYVNPDQVQVLIDALVPCLNNPRGARIDVHTGKKNTNDGRRQFDSTIFYVKVCEEPQDQQGGGYAPQQGGYAPPPQQPRQYAPVQPMGPGRGQQSPQTRERVQAAYAPQQQPPPQRQYAPVPLAPRPPAGYPVPGYRQPPPPMPVDQPPVDETGFAPADPNDMPV